MPQLRDYQLEACDEAERILRGDAKRLLMVSAVGSGKTEMFVDLARRFMDDSKRIMVMADRTELIEQAAKRIAANLGIFPGIEKADQTSPEGDCVKPPIVVSSVQTLTSGNNGYRRMQRFDPREFGLLIVDEAHHSVSSSWRSVIEYFTPDDGDCRVIGVTATPDRHDEKALGQVFDAHLTALSVTDAITLGWLVDIKQVPIHVNGLDFTRCRTTAGDLNGRDLDEVVCQEEVMLGIGGATVEESGDRQTIVFAPSVHNAEMLTEIINRYKPGSAVFVCGKTMGDDRHERINGYRDGRYQYLVNVGITVEGFDAPMTACIAMGRMTESRSKYEQMLGRGMRAELGCLDGLNTPEERLKAISYSAKPDLKVIDFVGISGAHKLANVYDILGGEWDDDVAELAMREAVKRDGTSVDVRQALREAAIQRRNEKEAECEREREKRRNIRPDVKYSRGKQISPLDVLDLNPYRMKAWEKDRTGSPKQIAMLEKCGIKNADKLPMNQCRQLITAIIDRRNKGLCTFKMARQLVKRGLPANVPMDVAGRWMGELSAAGWTSVPQSVRVEAEEYA